MRMSPRVPPAMVKTRTGLLRNLDRAKRLAFHNKQIGKTVSVLFESAEHDSYRIGTTPNFTRVAITDPADLQNRIMPVTITAATDRCAFGHIAQPQPKRAAMAML